MSIFSAYDQVGKFRNRGSLTLEEIKENGGAVYIGMDKAIDHLPAIEAPGDAFEKLRNGNPFDYTDGDCREP
jgi:tRNA U55 pseudouridine synthase TruB